MSIVATGLVVVVTLLHVWFLVLEMVLWRRPLGMRTFGLTPERAELTATLAANQGLYNGFLAGGWSWDFWSPSRRRSSSRCSSWPA